MLVEERGRGDGDGDGDGDVQPMEETLCVAKIVFRVPISPFVEVQLLFLGGDTLRH